MLNGGIAMKRTESMDRLFRTILNLESIDECYAYFEDLCTIKELNDMSQRLDAAILLADGLSYQKIMDQVAISTATIGRVSRCLNYGTGGYRSAINKLKED
jgi:TrpR-related protein YerC/YecD